MSFIKLMIPFFTCLLLLPLFIISPASSARPHDKNTSPFGFLDHLKGCHKGDKVKDVNKLKKYLETFGYLHYNHSDPHNHAKDDEFDDLLEAAVMTYQHNYHLKVTGTLDGDTVSRMMTPRCGVPDIVNGTNWMQRAKKKGRNHHQDSGSLHTVSHYSFFPGQPPPRWPSSKYSLTYSFAPGTPTEAITAVQKAFTKWSSQTHFRFTRTQNYGNADLQIGFARGVHNDNAPFDGRGGTLAHAYPPTVGVFHYDADERWATGAVQNAFDLETVALHEIGHLLGLGHSEDANAIMFASISHGVTKNLNQDDIQGIRDLYDV